VTCKLYQTELSAYLDGELPALRAKRLEAHLRVCPHCQGELQELNGISGYIRAATVGLQVSQDFDQRVLRAVGSYQLTRRISRRRSVLRPLLIAAVVLLALLATLQHFLLNPPPVPVPVPVRATVTPTTSPAPTLPDKDNTDQ
jgi:anti-sigma factor RsiW